ncbi:MAG: TonB-dependent receptor [Salinivirgaceae bacterium]|nr:TonB-dependent receptor [Salinivirgaceae bacterium]
MALTPNEYKTADSYAEISLKLGYTFPIKSIDSGIEIYGGIKNVTNVYQKDFDNYRNRNSDYIYGPAMPRTVYIGIKLKTM